MAFPPDEPPENEMIKEAFKFLLDLGFEFVGKTDIPYACGVRYRRGVLGIEIGVSFDGGRLEVRFRHPAVDDGVGRWTWSQDDRDFQFDCDELGIPTPTERGPFNFPAREPKFAVSLQQHAEALRMVLTHQSFTTHWKDR